jgi:DNA-binding beta-propeller fold protein YncE
MLASEQLSGMRLRRVTAACLVLWSMAEASAETLLIVRPESDVLEFFDPGSGLRLAAVTVGRGPRKVTVAPDGKRAATANCGTPTVTLSIVDLENPSELRRTALPLTSCPDLLTWFAEDRIAVAVQGAQGLIAIETHSGRNLGPLSSADRDVMEGLGPALRTVDPESKAVQQFIAAGGHLDQVAVTPVLPRATCHACSPES